VPIPDNEPVFILRAKDVLAEQTIAYYLTMVSVEQHNEAVKHRRNDFRQIRITYPQLMKAPDTIYPYPQVEKDECPKSAKLKPGCV